MWWWGDLGVWLVVFSLEDPSVLLDVLAAVSAVVSEAAVGTAVVLEEVGLVPVAAIGSPLAVGPQEVGQPCVLQLLRLHLHPHH